MFVPRFIRIERRSDGGHVLKLNQGFSFARKHVNINVSRSAAPNLAFVPAKQHNCGVKTSYVNACTKFHKDYKRFR